MNRACGFGLTFNDYFHCANEEIALIAQIETNGGYVHMPRQDLDYAVRVGLRMLRLRRMVQETGSRYAANPHETVLLRYYANAIAHHLDGR